MSQGGRRFEAHPKNVPGDFYVEDGCCTLCGIPQAVSPNLFSAIDDPTDHCYVKRQPENERELAQMIDTIAGAELQCIRYAGADRAIQARMVASSDGAACDHLLPEFAQRIEKRQIPSGDWPTPPSFESLSGSSFADRLKRRFMRMLAKFR